MAEGGFNRLDLPRLTHVSFSGMTLYRREPEAAVLIDKPVFCLIGANGLGKSTFLNSLVFAVTGAIPDPARAFQSAREYLAEATRPERVRDYFGDRLSEADRGLASVSATIAWTDAEIEITRPLAADEGIVRLVVRAGAGEQSFEGPEADERYRREVADRVRIGDFAQFTFLVHFILMFDEARHLLMWDDRVLTNALYLAFDWGPTR